MPHTVGPVPRNGRLGARATASPARPRRRRPPERGSRAQSSACGIDRPRTWSGWSAMWTFAGNTATSSAISHQRVNGRRPGRSADTAAEDLRASAHRDGLARTRDVGRHDRSILARPDEVKRARDHEEGREAARRSFPSRSAAHGGSLAGRATRRAAVRTARPCDLIRAEATRTATSPHVAPATCLGGRG